MDKAYGPPLITLLSSLFCFFLLPLRVLEAWYQGFRCPPRPRRGYEIVSTRGYCHGIEFVQWASGDSAWGYTASTSSSDLDGCFDDDTTLVLASNRATRYGHTHIGT
ncbi:hypothetical protein J3E68DRAFT_421676 [Trichoderma sp. SZMC 28012]